MADLTNEALDEIEKGVIHSQSKPCPSCGAGERTVAPHIFGLPNVGPSKNDGVGTMPLVAICCEKCGKVDLHQLAVVAPTTYAGGGKA